MKEFQGITSFRSQSVNSTDVTDPKEDTVMEIIQRIIPVAVNSKGKKRSLAEVLKNILPFEVEAPEEGDK